MTSQDEFFNDNYQALSEASIRISKGSQLSEDLLSYTIEVFLTRKDANEIINSGGARFFMVRIMLNSWNSSTSQFYNLYRKQNTEELNENHEEIPEEEDFTDYETADKISQIVGTLPWYERTIWEMVHLQGSNGSKISKETGIPKTSIYATLGSVNRIIKKKLKTKNDI